MAKTSPKKHIQIHVVIGPTASGKSEYAIRLAKKYNGEVISADSRQVYKGLDIGTGKVPGAWTKKMPQTFIYKKAPHYCIDFVSPKKQYTVADFQRDGTKALLGILSRGKTPIICGGTGLYIDALLLGQHLPAVPPNLKLRKKLGHKSTQQLFAMLEKKDPARAKNIDRHNPHRLIRALEIITATKKPVPPRVATAIPDYYQHNGTYIPLRIHYPHPRREALYKRITQRLAERIKGGMLKEAFTLHAQGLSWKRMDELGLEYRYLAQFLKKQKGTMPAKQLARAFILSDEYAELLSEIKKYSKRQETWFKKYEKNGQAK